MMNETKATGDTRHVFEHLGPAPYKYTGFEVKTYQACHGAPIQPGSTCDHCGTAIKDVYNFTAADGVEFHVGSSCVEKSGDKGLYSKIKRQVNAVKRERKAVTDAARIAAGRELFAANREAFAAAPHPRGFENRETGEALTLADQIDWMLENCGTSGRVRTCREIEKFVAAL